MTDVLGLSADSEFVGLLGDIPAPTVLAYVHESWMAYAEAFKNASPPFQKRNEPQLTQALGAYLRKRLDDGEQPFAGDFYAELSHYVFEEKTGLPKCVARTDIEWRLFGVPAFVFEFKLLDGKGARRQSYLSEGVMRFIRGRYSSGGSIGAMFALLRKAAVEDPGLLRAEITNNASAFSCSELNEASAIVPTLAAFDSTHSRNAPHVSPFRLAHLFVPLPDLPALGKESSPRRRKA